MMHQQQQHQQAQLQLQAMQVQQLQQLQQSAHAPPPLHVQSSMVIKVFSSAHGVRFYQD